MHIEFLVEEPSAAAALNNLLPKILKAGISFNIRSYQGKEDLKNKLPDRLAGYRQWIPSDWRLVVLMDRDDDDCKVLKDELERIADSKGFVTKSSTHGAKDFQVVNRLAIEELEAWFFGDVDAICAVYPGVPDTLGQKAKFRDPDAIKGGTWEALQRVLQNAGHYRAGMPKIETARRISEQMDPARNRSKSFQVFRNVLIELTR